MPTATRPLATALDVAAQLRALEETLVGLGPELVPERIAKSDLAGVLRSLGRIERCAGGARIVLTKAAADVGAWKAAGARSPAEWAAQANGTTVGQARADLEASGQLERLPATRDAAASGRLSTEATKAIAAGATADRTAEQTLLAKGTAGDLTGTRSDARRARQRADERDGKAALRMYQRRQLRTWIELDGEGRGQWNVPPSYQAVFLAALEPYRQEAFRHARAAGQRPSAEALMADALQLLCLDVLTDHHLPIPDAAHTGPPGGPHQPRATNTPTAAGSTAAGTPGASEPTTTGTPGASESGAPSTPDANGPTSGAQRSGPANPPAATGSAPAGTPSAQGSGAPAAPRPTADPGHPDDPGHTAGPGHPAGPDPGHPGGPDPTRPEADPVVGGPGATDQAATPPTARPGLLDDPDDPAMAAPETEARLFGPDRPPGGGPDEPSPDRTATPATTGTPAAPAATAPPSGPGRGPTKAPRPHRRAPAQIMFHIDVAAWLRGHTNDDEVCEIAGMGPVPVSLARAFAADAVLKLIVRDGADITTITSHRRYIPAALRTALDARDRECVVPGCHVTRGLEIDHIHDFAKGGPTAAANNARLCGHHHFLKTHCGWILHGPPGHWTFTPPDTS